MGQQTQMSGGKTSSALPGQNVNPPGTPVGVAPQGKGGSQQGQLMQTSQPVKRLTQFHLDNL